MASSAHPMYVAWTLIRVATGLTIGSRWTLVTAPIAATVVRIENVAEERRLRAAFPEEAAHCLESTPRYLPRPSQLCRVAASKFLRYTVRSMWRGGLARTVKASADPTAEGWSR